MAARLALTERRIDINMTPMIDVVFQLLTFFLMTFRVASAEGDFSLLLPRGDPHRGVGGNPYEIAVRVEAAPDGDLLQIRVDRLPGFTGRGTVDRLHEEVVRIVAAARNLDQEEPSVVLDVDDRLRYEHLMRVVAAVSQQADEAGNVAPLVKKIKFAPR